MTVMSTRGMTSPARRLTIAAFRPLQEIQGPEIFIKLTLLRVLANRGAHRPDFGGDILRLEVLANVLLLERR